MGNTPRQLGRREQRPEFKVTQLVFTVGGRQSHEEWHQERHNIFDELTRKLAGLVGVNPTIISRWRADDAFKQQVLRARRLLDRGG